VRKGEIALEQIDRKGGRGLAVLTISGEHDLGTAPALRQRLDQLQEGDRGIVIDLSPATFVDSTILGLIIEARRRAVEAKQGFGVAQNGQTEAVARVLEITGLRDELPVHSDRAAAEAEASGPEDASG
jgi:anti-sigma B factor antagonist